MNRRERRAAAREVAGRAGLKGTKKQQAVREISAAFLRNDGVTKDARVVARGAHGSRLEQRESGLVVARSELA